MLAQLSTDILQINQPMFVMAVRAAMKKHKATQIELAEVIGVSTGHFSSCMSGERNKFQPEQIEKLAQYLHIDLKALPGEDAVLQESASYYSEPRTPASATYDQVLVGRLCAAACGIRGGFGRDDTFAALQDIIRDAQTLLTRMAPNSEAISAAEEGARTAGTLADSELQERSPLHLADAPTSGKSSPPHDTSGNHKRPRSLQAAAPTEPKT
jgi:transcriptional regulator with XRE-family HTH domain